MPIHIAQLGAFPAQTPPTTSVAELLAWLVAVAFSVSSLLFWLHVRALRARFEDKKEECADLKVDLGKADVRIEALEQRIAELQEQRVSEAQKRAEDDKRIASKILSFERRDAVAASQRPGPMHGIQSDEDWSDIPTGVANAVAVVKEQPVLARPQAPQPYRSKQKSMPAVEVDGRKKR